MEVLKSWLHFSESQGPKVHGDKNYQINYIKHFQSISLLHFPTRPLRHCFRRLLPILQPVSLRHSDIAISIKGIKPNTSISPKFNATVRTENSNKKIGIYYERNSSVAVYFLDVMLCEGSLPALYQPARNVTVMAAKLKGSGIRLWSTKLKGSGIRLWSSAAKALKVDLRAPMKLKVYSVRRLGQK
ncbi:NDR1/HIN1-like protein 13 [Cucurbita moschata]|uniref:NDR1/HIN1-like protein 13 n=1 Tax=Cucurbita moschata TaxID=3662 RepID=A0A6J1FW35_CUCMO|nr:NDR1/HIN1-like protein 13 [Cucurbita moschata]